MDLLQVSYDSGQTQPRGRVTALGDGENPFALVLHVPAPVRRFYECLCGLLDMVHAVPVDRHPADAEPPADGYVGRTRAYHLRRYLRAG